MIEDHDYDTVIVNIRVPKSVANKILEEQDDINYEWNYIFDNRRVEEYLGDTTENYWYEHTDRKDKGNNWLLKWVVHYVDDVDIAGLLEKEYVASVWLDQTKFKLVDGEVVED